MPVDELQQAVERTVPSFRGRTGDWDAVLEAVHAQETPRLRDWRWPSALALAAVLALVLFWPDGRNDGRVLERALAAVDGGPVIHLVLRSGMRDFYDLERGEFRRVPVIHELWYDAQRGMHDVESVDGEIGRDILSPPGRSEVDRQFVGLAAAYRKALRERNASVGERGALDGKQVYWIMFRVRYPEVGMATYDHEHEVAVDAKTFEPVSWRVDGGAGYRILRWQNLPRGQGDFSAKRTDGGVDGELWYGVTRVGFRKPAEARNAFEGALWLGETFADLPLAFIRELRYETGKTGAPLRSLPGLELCYGSGEPCGVFATETTEPHSMAGRGHGWELTPPPGTLAFADRGTFGYLVRDGLYVTLEGRSREELIKAAEALTPIPD
jgi:hypothetical protein